MKRIGDLNPRDKFELWGEEWVLLEKISREGGGNPQGPGGVVIRSIKTGVKVHVPWDILVKADEIPRRPEKREKKLLLTEVISSKNPHINRGVYVEIILLLGLFLGLIAFVVFMGH